MGATLGIAILDTAVDLAGLVKGLDSAQDETEGRLNKLGKRFSSVLAGVGVAAAAAAGAAIVGVGAAAFSVANDIDQATGLATASLGKIITESNDIDSVITSVFRDNFGDSIADVGASVTTVAQQMGRFGQLTDDELINATEKALSLRDAFGLDVAESTNAVNALMQNFGITADEAFTFVTSGIQNGLDASGDFIDTIGEYSNQFSEGGATAEQFFSFLDTGLASGVLGTDKAADAFKEFRVRIQDGSDLTKDSLEAIGINADELAEGFTDGSVTAIDAFNQVQRALRDTENENTRFNAGVGLLGTQYEDLGESAILAIDPLTLTMEDIASMTNDTNEQYNNLNDIVQGFGRQALVALRPIGDVILTLAMQLLPLVQDAFAFIEPVIMSVAAALGEFVTQTLAGQGPLVEFVTQAANFIEPLTSLIAEFVSWTDVLIVLAGAILAVVVPAILSIIVSLAPVFLAIGAAIAIVALMRTAWENDWGGIQAKVQTVITFVQNLINTVMVAIQTFWAQNGDAILAKAQQIWDAVREFINTAITTISEFITTTMETVQQFWADNGETILTTAEDTWTTIMDFIQTVLDNIVGPILDAFTSAFEGDWRAFGENIRTAFDNALQLIKDAISGLWDLVRPILSTFVSNAIDAVVNIDWAGVGSSIIQGIAGGISAGASFIVDAARSAAQAALDAAKGLLGIESPSKVAQKEIGGAYIDGIVRGIQNISPVVRAVGGVVDALVPQTAVGPRGSRLAGVQNLAGAGIGAPQPAGAMAGPSTTIVMDFRGTPFQLQNFVRQQVQQALAQEGVRSDIRTRTR